MVIGLHKTKCLIMWGGRLDKSGVPIVLYNIISHLRKDIEFTLAILEGNNPMLESFLEYGTRICYINDNAPSNSLLRKVWYYIFRMRALKKQAKTIMDNEVYDCCYCVAGPNSGIYVKLAAKHGIPSRIVHCHGKVWSNVGLLRRFQLQKLKKDIEKYATYKLTCSYDAGTTLFINTTNMVTIINGIDISQYPFIEKKSNNSIISLLQIGYYNSIKNQLFTIDVVNALSKYCAVKMKFIGYIHESDKNYYDLMKSKIESLGLTNIIEFLPKDTDKNLAFSQTDILLLPSLAEACPLVALEAQVTQTKILASSCVPKDVDYGLMEFVEGWNKEEWAERIIKLKSKHLTLDNSIRENDLINFTKKIYYYITH